MVSPDDLHADYRVPIFTTVAELPFAGHPTLGACHAWLTNGGAPRQPDVVVQECGVGLVPVRVRAPYVASQGTILGRRGRVHVEQDDAGTVWVGGGTFTCISGEVDL